MMKRFPVLVLTQLNDWACKFPRKLNIRLKISDYSHSLPGMANPLHNKQGSAENPRRVQR
jgi:hypothetical protein